MKSEKKNMQTVQFRHLDDFYEFLPDNEIKLVLALRQLIYDCIPLVQEKLSYNVPYYYRKRNICFIWPASILWGKKQSYEGVRLGFTSGYLLKDEGQYLERGLRKQVYWRDFKEMKELDVMMIRALLYEAVQIDDGKR